MARVPKPKEDQIWDNADLAQMQQRLAEIDRELSSIAESKRIHQRRENDAEAKRVALEAERATLRQQRVNKTRDILYSA